MTDGLLTPPNIGSSLGGSLETKLVFYKRGILVSFCLAGFFEKINKELGGTNTLLIQKSGVSNLIGQI